MYEKAFSTKSVHLKRPKVNKLIDNEEISKFDCWKVQIVWTGNLSKVQYLELIYISSTVNNVNLTYRHVRERERDLPCNVINLVF